MSRISSFVLTFIGILSPTWPAGICTAQETQDSLDVLQKFAPRVFLDCPFCDEDFIRTEITFVNYVRDRLDAQIHVLVTSQSTGSGGTEYTMTLIGQHEFAGMEDTLTYVANTMDTEDITRKEGVRVLKAGLLRYVMKTRLAPHMSVNFEKSRAPTLVSDMEQLGLQGQLEQLVQR